jgi:hypothetical protein
MADETHYGELRARCAQYMRHHEEDFAPFIEDDRSFTSYVAEMSRDGVWGGNLELQALSMALAVNIRIHQLSGTPSFDLRNHRSTKAPVVHLSYHRDQHYASVRPEDTKHSRGPAGHPPLPSNASSSSNERSSASLSPESDESSTNDDVALCIEVNNRVAGIETAVANALRTLRSLHHSCASHGRHHAPAHQSSSDTSPRVPHCCQCHGRACKAGLQRHAIAAAEDEAASIRDILAMAERQSRRIALIHSDSNSEDCDHRLERRRRRLLEALTEVSTRASAFERHVNSLYEKETKLQKPAAAGPADTQQASNRPSRKKVQEAKRQERKARRRQEQERAASGKAPHPGAGSALSNRIDI